MKIPFFPAPSEAVIDEAKNGKHIKAARMWVKEARANLANGDRVAPSPMFAMQVVKSIAKGLPALKMAVQRGKYQEARRVEAAEEKEKLLAERFAFFMKEDKPAATTTGVCDVCDEVGKHVTNHYAPDGMGYPTIVSQTCVVPCDQKTTLGDFSDWNKIPGGF
tara:strand:+ start:3190 stop:3678 length:489 start_codon:yes stop_codon:yes gene_type:complete